MPEELLLFLQCEKYHSLLTEGGILDQPYWLWHMVDFAGLCYKNALADIQQDEMDTMTANQLAEEAMKNALIQNKS